eukprot:SAG31_NODE_601_length_13643_cov_64.237005_1_plen_45_part_10
MYELVPVRTADVNSCTVVFREIETAVPDERILVLFVPYILLAISY